MGILNGNPKDEPLHVGEVFDLFTTLAGIQGAISCYQVYLNHVGDKDLRQFITDKIENSMRPQIQKLSEILKANGISLPPAPPEKGHADLESIPSGARLLDAEIAVIISKDIGMGLVACSQAMGIAIREDVAMLYGQMHMETAQYGAKLLKLMKEKAWLIPPPLMVKPNPEE